MRLHKNFNYSDHYYRRYEKGFDSGCVVPIADQIVTLAFSPKKYLYIKEVEFKREDFNRTTVSDLSEILIFRSRVVDTI